MRKTQSYILLTMFLLFGLNSKADNVDFSQKQSFEEIERLANEQGKSIFIDVYADWCVPCQKMSADVFSDKGLSKLINEKFISIKIDADKVENQAILKRFMVDAYPTIIMYNPKDYLQDKFVGYQSVEQLMQHSNDFLLFENDKFYQMQRLYKEGNRNSRFVLSYLTELKNKELPYKGIAGDFVHSESFKFSSKEDLEILFLADLPAENVSIKLFLNSINTEDILHQKVFLQIAVGVFDKSFRYRDFSFVRTFTDDYRVVFEAITGVKMDSQDIINYLGDLHDFKI